MSSNNGKVTFLYDKMIENPATTIRIYKTINSEGSGYSELVAKGFFTNDFYVNITNSWGGDDGSMISGALNTAKSFAQQAISRDAKAVTGVFSSIAKLGSENFDKGGLAQRAFSSADKLLDKVQDLQNSAILTSNDFYKTFKGTQVSFPMSITIELLSSQTREMDEQGENSDIYEKLKKILDVSIGEYETELYLFGIQLPPNGYNSGSEINLTNPTALIEGSLSAVWGEPGKGGMEVKNLVISSVQLSFSKTKVKIAPNTYRPLKITVNIMMETAKKFTKPNLLNTLGFVPEQDTSSSNFAPSGSVDQDSNPPGMVDNSDDNSFSDIAANALDINNPWGNSGG